MRPKLVLLVMGLALLLSACGGGATGNVGGTWDGTLKLNGGAGTTFQVRYVFTDNGGKLSGTFSDCSPNFSQCQQSGTVSGQRNVNNATFTTDLGNQGGFDTGGVFSGNTFSGLTNAAFTGDVTATVTLTKK